MDEQKLREIRDAEQMARNILATVDEESQTIIRNAHNEVNKLMDETKTYVRKEEDRILVEYSKKGTEQAETILSMLKTDLMHVDKKADVGEKEAIAFVLSEMKVSYGNR
ncbi:hypothetical protein SAMN02745150_00420 [Brevinema andersonii]|uniref:V/A-type H+-transporting ATPase subunit G/H n=1 Tax=Brevinema andersonii TaxID=34097 RepID=A0A1I1DAJ4_BREAD|nr:hypothetical protein [Brevinema andersonii]SFB71356.1 hypothetical protein SAMN02745150_00420 [Brevinema andersonii]